MKERYYCLLLNNCFDKGIHYLANGTYSMLPNVLIKDYIKLNTLEEDFMGLDDTITPFQDFWLVKGSFPVIAKEIDGEMYDVITGKLIEYSVDGKDVNGLSYKEKSLVQSAEMMELMLSKIDEESKERYSDELSEVELYSKKIYENDLPEETYYLLVPNDNGTITPVLTAKSANKQVIDTYTNEKIYYIPSGTITSHLNYTVKRKIDKELALTPPIKVSSMQLEEYQSKVDKARKNSIARYNNYIKDNLENSFEDKKDPMEKPTPKRIRKK